MQASLRHGLPCDCIRPQCLKQCELSLCSSLFCCNPPGTTLATTLSEGLAAFRSHGMRLGCLMLFTIHPRTPCNNCTDPPCRPQSSGAACLFCTPKTYAAQ